MRTQHPHQPDIRLPGTEYPTLRAAPQTREGSAAPSFATLPANWAAQQDGSQVHLQYAASDSFVAFLRDRWGLAGMRAILLDLRAGKTVDEAMTKTIGYGLADLEALWRRDVLSEGS